MKFSYFKVSCCNIGNVMARANGNSKPTEKELDEFIRILNKDEEKITDRQKSVLQNIMLKQAAYDPNKLSETARKEIAKIYSYEMYGKNAISYSKGSLPTEKGSFGESESIRMLSRVDNIGYKKNQNLILNRYLKGKPDLYLGSLRRARKVIDIKTSYDLPAFLSLMNTRLDSEYYWQMLGYLDLTNCEYGEVCFCLINMPEHLMNAEIAKLSKHCHEAGYDQQKIDEKIMALRHNMTYDEIPEVMRVLKFPVERSESRMKDIIERVKVVRLWLKDLHKAFEKPLTLITNSTH